MDPSLAGTLEGKAAAGPRVPTERLGMWWFLASEAAIFAGMLVVYLVNHRPDWAAESHALQRDLGAVGMAVLLASCGTMAQAAAAARRGARRTVRNWLAATFVLGVAYLACTGMEYARALAEGHGLGTHRFWAHWFLMTGVHAVHVLAGVLAMASLLLVDRRGTNHGRAGTLALYWLFLGLVWCVYFPLLYPVP